MKETKWEQEREKRRRDSLERHARLHKLFIKDRLAFEREKRRIIDEFIKGEKDKEKRKRLRDLQASWDATMRGAGSEHNRLVLAQTLFWSHFYETWCPAVQELNAILKDKG